MANAKSFSEQTASWLGAFGAWAQVAAIFAVAAFAYQQFKEQNALHYVERVYAGQALENRLFLAERIEDLEDTINKSGVKYDKTIEYFWTFYLRLASDQDLQDARDVRLAQGAQVRLLFFANLYDEVAKCDELGLCEHSVLIHYVADQMATHYNLLFPWIATGKLGGAGSRYLQWITTAARCGHLASSFLRYENLNVGNFQFYEAILSPVPKPQTETKDYVKSLEPIVCDDVGR